MNAKAVYRTAPAPPGLLNIEKDLQEKNLFSKVSKFWGEIF